MSHPELAGELGDSGRGRHLPTASPWTHLRRLWHRLRRTLLRGSAWEQERTRRAGPSLGARTPSPRQRGLWPRARNLLGLAQLHALPRRLLAPPLRPRLRRRLSSLPPAGRGRSRLGRHGEQTLTVPVTSAAGGGGLLAARSAEARLRGAPPAGRFGSAPRIPDARAKPVAPLLAGGRGAAGPAADSFAPPLVGRRGGARA